MNKTYNVYTHTAPNGDVYVGVTGMKYISERWKPSLYKSTALQTYIEQFGWKNIIHQVIYTTPDKEEAYQVEEEMRQYYTEKGCCINKRKSGLILVKDKNAYNSQWKKEKRQSDPVFREKENERSRKYQQEHRQERNAYLRQWKKDNPEFREKKNEYQRQYRLKKKQSQSDNLGIAS